MKKNKMLIIGILIITNLFLIACGMIPFINITRGSGDVITETRAVSNFYQIQLDGAGRLIITQGTEESLEIQAEDNIMPRLTAEVENSTLILGYPELTWRTNIIPTHTITYRLTVTDLTGLTINGAAQINIESFEAPSMAVAINGAGRVNINQLMVDSLDVRIAGAGSVEVAGEALDQTVSIEGAGNYQAGDFKTITTDISIDGLGNATVWAVDNLNVSISGAGNMSYYGAMDISKNISGAGNITFLGEK